MGRRLGVNRAQARERESHSVAHVDEPLQPIQMRISSRELGRSILLAGAAVTAACDVPTAAPKWNTTWQVPADSSEIGVASLLPSAVTVVTVDGVKAFEIGLPGSDVSESLGQMCPSCASANGYRVPKP